MSGVFVHQNNGVRGLEHQVGAEDLPHQPDVLIGVGIPGIEQRSRFIFPSRGDSSPT